MNIRISVYVPYSGTPDGLEPLVGALCDTIVEQGYGVKLRSDELVSLVSVDESDIDEFGSTESYALHILRTSLMTAIPRERGIQ